MSKVSKKDYQDFDDNFRKSLQRIGNGRIAVEKTRVRDLVRTAPEAAYYFVEAHCLMAQSQPGYLQPAFIVAEAYQAEFQDDVLIKMVLERAHNLNAEEHLQEMGVYKNMEEALAEPPERAAGRAWWQSSGKTQAHCDSCNHVLRRDEGYLIRGRVVAIANQFFVVDEELLCTTCFYKLRTQRRLSTAEYKSIAHDTRRFWVSEAE